MGIEFFNALFNIAHLVLLIFIIQLLLKDRRRGDALEKRYHDLEDGLDQHIQDPKKH